MRLGEICGIRKEHIKGNYVILPDTKNNERRDVPLTPEAQRLVQELVQLPPVKPANASKIFSMATRKAEIDGLVFHDTRHEATMFLAKKITNPLDLAKITGHKSLTILLNVYYAPRAVDLAEQLA
jgi:integrase